MGNRLTILVFLILLGNTVFAQQPTKWRGPNANGVYEAPNLLASWPADGPEVIWSFEGLGEGFSSPAFANGKIYCSGMIDGTGYVFVLDQNGKEISKMKYGDEFTESYGGARSTPTVVGNLIYMLSGLGVLVCLDENSGTPQWSKNLFKDFDGINIRWGVTESVVVDGDMLYCSPGGKTNNVIALNRMNGDLIWSCKGLGELSAYCTPLLVKLPSRKILVNMMASHILGIDASSGKLLWSQEQINRWSVHANTPIFYDNALFCFSGYGQGGVKLNLSPDGSSISKAWFSKSFDSRIGGAVAMNGYIYGSGDASRAWQCLDFKTGEQKYASTDLGKGVVIAAGNKLICYSERGELALVDSDPNTFKILSKTKVGLGTGQHWAHPVVNNGILYVRHGNTLIAYKISV